MTYTNPHFDPTVIVQPDKNGMGCPHCDWRFLTDHGLTNHIQQFHPAADIDLVEVEA